jgi:hypothetical protein
MSKFMANVSTLPYCCGVVEAGDFVLDYDDDYREYNEDTAEALVAKIFGWAEGVPVIFNFVKCKNWKGEFDALYQAHELRTYVRSHPNVVHLSKFINPNSGNRVDSYMIKDYKNG